MTMMGARPKWRKSTYSNAQANCVEVAGQPGTVAVRDTKDPHGPTLAFSPRDWRQFARRVKAGGPA
jgi:Domain of unknown function (DUF397)